MICYGASHKVEQFSDFTIFHIQEIGHKNDITLSFRQVFDSFSKKLVPYNDIVNIALHISLKNFEQQCNGINIHVA